MRPHEDRFPNGRRVVEALYVPVTSLILALSVGNYWALHQAFDPNAAGQNPDPISTGRGEDRVRAVA